MEYTSPTPLPPIPTNLSIPQFMFDYHAAPRPIGSTSPWIVADGSAEGRTRDELKRRTSELASGLENLYDIQEDNVVLIYARNHIDYPVVIWAVHTLGGIVSPANPAFTPSELSYQLQATQAKLIITSPDSLESALAVAVTADRVAVRVVVFDVEPNEQQTKAVTVRTIEEVVEVGRAIAGGKTRRVGRPLQRDEGKRKIAFLSFSSGTTGRPKAVSIPHHSVIANVIQMSAHTDAGRADGTGRYRVDDVVIGVLPFYHIYGLVLNMHFVIFAGMTLLVIPKFNFEDMLKSIVRHRIAHLFLVPPQIVLLLKHPATASYPIARYVRSVMFGAAPVSEEVTRQLWELLPEAATGQAYGMTETCTAVTIWSTDHKRGIPGGAGKLLPGVAARVVKEDGSLAAHGELGELHVQSPANAIGYANDTEATETFVDGWIRTGDEVYFDKNMELFVVDRLKEIMKVKGYQVAPAELEGCILDHPDVSDVCVVGIPNEYSGEVPLAFISLSAAALKRFQSDGDPALKEIENSVIKLVADNKTSYKRLAGGVVVIDVIPKTPSGKLLRRVLREKVKELARVRAKL